MVTTLASDAALLEQITTFCARHDLPPTTFGRRAIGDANLIANLQTGRELRRATTARVRAFMASYSAEPVQVAA